MIFRKTLKAACLAVPFFLIAPSIASAIDSFSSYESAEFYHDHSSQQWSVATKALSEHVFRGTESILEIGCRGGKIAANLAGRVQQGQVTATEMRGAGAIQFANQNYNKKLYPNLSFLEQDFLGSNYSNQFDLAVSFSSLHWYADQTTILQKAYKALKTNGQILFTIPGKPKAEITDLITELTGRDEWKQYFKTYTHPRKKFTADEYASLLTEVGFKSLDIKLQQCEYAFENKRSLMNWFKSFSPYLDSLPEDRIEDFLTEFANAYVQYFAIQPDGQIPFIQDELFIKAVK